MAQSLSAYAGQWEHKRAIHSACESLFTPQLTGSFLWKDPSEPETNYKSLSLFHAVDTVAGHLDQSRDLALQTTICTQGTAAIDQASPPLVEHCRVPPSGRVRFINAELG